MSTANEIELLLITISLTTLCIIAVIFTIQCILLVTKARVVVGKAEKVIENVESAAEAIGRMGRASKSHFPLLNFFHSLVNNEEKDRK